MTIGSVSLFAYLCATGTLGMSCVVGGPLTRLRVSWLAACVLLLSLFSLTPRVTVSGLQLVAAARARKRAVVLCMCSLLSCYQGF